MAEQSDIFKRGENVCSTQFFSLCLVIICYFLEYQVATSGYCDTQEF